MDLRRIRPRSFFDIPPISNTLNFDGELREIVYGYNKPDGDHIYFVLN